MASAATVATEAAVTEASLAVAEATRGGVVAVEASLAVDKGGEGLGAEVFVLRVCRRQLST